VISLKSAELQLEIIVVDDASTDRSIEIARGFTATCSFVRVLRHERNQGKGAALRTGFRAANGDFVAVQDADLEYDPSELKDLLRPLRDGRADVVIGSRFKGDGAQRVLYFWHYVGNRVLTLLSNMCTDLNLSDMETCYKVFKRDVIASIDIEEDRFGFEPEIIAKISHRRLRIYEMGISYAGRTYEEGKKIGWKDGVRALYCIVRYNAVHLPLPIQFLVYTLIGSTAALMNLGGFVVMLAYGMSLTPAIVISFIAAAVANYLLCLLLLFRHRARWNSLGEVMMYVAVVAVSGLVDVEITRRLFAVGTGPWLAKASASFVGLVLNFYGRRALVF
jgi:glycosyltransferase involved in cell wall biosynthesis